MGNLENIDEILADTADDLARVRALKERADKAKEFADEVLASAESVVAALDEAAQAQEMAGDAIDKATVDINDAQNIILQVGWSIDIFNLSTTSACEKLAGCCHAGRGPD